jgi:large-conductance mechanosensitive channel
MIQSTCPRIGGGAMLDEFTQIRRKTNALALAVAVIIGPAIGKVVSSVVTTS